MVKLAPGAELGESDLHAFIRDRYGPHLVPEVITLSDRIPTTEQGKPDRKEITGMAFGRDVPAAAHEAPASEGGI